jgi:uncharacterized membrane protein
MWTAQGSGARVFSSSEQQATLMAMLQLWLFLHILGAIVAFGFGFTAPIFGSMAAKEPQHANWYLRSVKKVSDYVIIPVAASMAITGYLLVVETGGSERFKELWLGLGVAIYLVALLAVFAVQRPTLNKVISLTSQPPGPDGPDPDVPKLINRLKYTGMGLGIAVVVIVFLMVFKPVL